MPVICRFPTGTKVDTQLSETSDNPVANSTVTKAINLSNEKIDELNGVTLTGTLTTGQTEIIFEDERITEDSVLNAVYTSLFDVSVESAVFNNGSLTLTFLEQAEDMSVDVIIDASLVGGSTNLPPEELRGEDGQDGKDGVDGKSAYQYAVDGGYEGTEEEFMALLGGLENIGESTPTEGVSSWQHLNTVTNNTSINLPSEWEEIYIMMYDNTEDEMAISWYYSKDMIDDLCSDEGIASINLGIPSSNNRCDYNKNNNTITPLMWQGSISTDITTKVYYKKKSPITVNVGTESNWEYWGETTGSNIINLPSEWEEIHIISYSDTSHLFDCFINKAETLVKDTILKGDNIGEYYEAQWVYSNNTINLNNFYTTSNLTTSAKTKVFYKKKCDNVLDINDMGRWTELKSYNASDTDVDITDIFGYNEVCFSAYNTSDSSYPMVSSTYVVDQLKDNTALISVSGCTTNSRHYSLKLFRSSNYYTISKSEYTQDNTLYNTNVKVSIYVR